jgi:hypothetical protein
VAFENAQYFSGGSCDTDHCLVIAKVRDRLAVSKLEAQKLDVERKHGSWMWKDLISES